MKTQCSIFYILQGCSSRHADMEKFLMPGGGDLAFDRHGAQFNTRNKIKKCLLKLF